MDKLYAANLRGNIKYYVLAAVLPAAAYFISANITGMIFAPDYSISAVLNGDNITDFFYVILQIGSISLVLFPLYFGEEYGWRAYLAPKLETLMPKPAAHIVSGVIWGMWHAPVVYLGHDFGTEYSFFPYGGYIVMSVFCIFMGCFLSWLTERTGSIYPACICHSINNNVGSTMLMFFVSGSMTEEIYLSNQFEIVSVGLLPMAVVCIPFMILLLKKNRNDLETSA